MVNIKEYNCGVAGFNWNLRAPKGTDKFFGIRQVLELELCLVKAADIGKIIEEFLEQTILASYKNIPHRKISWVFKRGIQN